MHKPLSLEEREKLVVHSDDRELRPNGETARAARQDRMDRRRDRPARSRPDLAKADRSRLDRPNADGSGTRLEWTNADRSGPRLDRPGASRSRLERAAAELLLHHRA